MIRNSTADGMGRFPRLPGKVRIFEDDGRGTVQSRDLSYELTMRQGINRTQENVTLE